MRARKHSTVWGTRKESTSRASRSSGAACRLPSIHASFLVGGLDRKARSIPRLWFRHTNAPGALSWMAGGARRTTSSPGFAPIGTALVIVQQWTSSRLVVEVTATRITPSVRRTAVAMASSLHWAIGVLRLPASFRARSPPVTLPIWLVDDGQKANLVATPALPKFDDVEVLELAISCVLTHVEHIRFKCLGCATADGNSRRAQTRLGPADLPPEEWRNRLPPR